MHMSSTFSNQPILKGDRSVLAKWLWQRLKPDRWPLRMIELPPGSALVGGVVRDGLLNKFEVRSDLDFLVPSNAVEVARRLAEKLDGRFVLLDSERDMARLILNGWTIDFATQVGESLEEDLWRRDFRINAIALTLEKVPQIIDPTGGLKDLFQKCLVAVSEQNLLDDPLRLLRALRLMAELKLSLDAQTRSWIKAHSNLLAKAAPERIQSELLRLAKAPWADGVIPFLKDSYLLGPWENKDELGNREVPSLNASHSLTPIELSIALPLSRLTHLLSDDGLDQLRFSRRQRQSCQLLRQWQKRNDGLAFESLSEVDRLQLHKDLEANLPALILELPLTQQSIWLQRWRDSNDPLFHPSSPLDGYTLQEILGVSKSPELGQLMSHLCQERAFGRVHNREEAQYAAHYWWEHK